MLYLKYNSNQILFIDTCTLINLATNRYNDSGKIVRTMLELMTNKNFNLILPEQVRNEWNKNKDIKVVKERVKSFKAKIKNIREYVNDFEQSDRDVIIGVLNRYSNNNTKMEDVLRNNINIIDDMLKNAQIISADEEAQKKTLIHGLEKKAPFQDKNSTADALIFLIVLAFFIIKKVR